MTNDDFDRSEDEALSRAARSLHEEWDSPELWPRIAAAIRSEDQRPTSPGWWHLSIGPAWQLAAAAIVLVAISAATWMVWRGLPATPPARDVAAVDERLLTDEAVAQIERSEAQYVRAIDELTRLTRPKLEMPDSPLIATLRERLMTIDAAIDEYRKEIDKNRFNAHLRQQLLWIYQEKRRTLEQVQETTGHAS
jgi:hypothetical protein